MANTNKILASKHDSFNGLVELIKTKNGHVVKAYRTDFESKEIKSLKDATNLFDEKVNDTIF